MDYHTRLKSYFEKQGISQRKAAEKLGISESMMSKYLKSLSPNYDFIMKLEDAFPDIDFNYLFKKENMLKVVREPAEEYGNPHKLIDEIERNLQELRKKI